MGWILILVDCIISNIFFHSVGCLFILFMVSFAVQKTLSLLPYLVLNHGELHLPKGHFAFKSLPAFLFCHLHSRHSLSLVSSLTQTSLFVSLATLYLTSPPECLLGISNTACSKLNSGDLPGGPVVKTPCFHCRGRGFNPWSGIPTCCTVQPKTKSCTLIFPTRMSPSFCLHLSQCYVLFLSH